MQACEREHVSLEPLPDEEGGKKERYHIPLNEMDPIKRYSTKTRRIHCQEVT